jgi:hypothetical protein
MYNVKTQLTQLTQKLVSYRLPHFERSRAYVAELPNEPNAGRTGSSGSRDQVKSTDVYTLRSAWKSKTYDWRRINKYSLMNSDEL